MRGIGIPEILILVMWLVPAWILWKFYQVLSRIADNLAGIRQTLGDRPRA